MPFADRLRRVTFVGTMLASPSTGPLVPPPPTQPAATGRIEGTVVISNALASRRPQFRIYADPGPGATPPAPPRDALAAEVRNVVVYLEGDSTQFPLGEPKARARR